jgi:hypothetical protein
VGHFTTTHIRLRREPFGRREMRLLTLAYTVCALVSAAGGMASANYVWEFAATGTDNHNYGSVTLIGVASAALTAGQSWSTSNCAFAAEVVLTDPANPGTSAKTCLWKKDYYTTEKARFYIQLWAGLDFPGSTFDVRVWCGSNNTTGGCSARPLGVSMAYDPTGGIAPGTVLLSGVPPYIGSQAYPDWLRELPAYKTDTPMASGCGYILQLDVTPEPSCMLALLTGIGLLALRRRR